ncbi:MAG: hypothetical protein LC679_08400 [Intrasporangiaceae bacterium]|nr:hypothetical protein [Intrasporangiaceae bacterium]
MGRRLERLLDQEGLDHRAIEVAGETREAMILLVDEPDESYHVVPRGPSLVEDEGHACLDALLDEAAPGMRAPVSCWTPPVRP